MNRSSEIIRVETVGCWSDWRGQYEHVLSETTGAREVNGRYIFRGHAWEDWRLASTFDRTFPFLDGDDRLATYQRSIRCFREMAENLGYRMEIRDETELQALAQHHGLPTRLLDWTFSPYIATYFAFAGVGLGVDGHAAVWALDTKLCAERIPKDRLSVVPASGAFNERLRHQKGVFTLLEASFECIEDFLEDFFENGGVPQPVVIKFVLPRSAAVTALSDLDLMNVSTHSLFGGLDGVAKDTTLEMFRSVSRREEGEGTRGNVRR